MGKTTITSATSSSTAAPSVSLTCRSLMFCSSMDSSENRQKRPGSSILKQTVHIGVVDAAAGLNGFASRKYARQAGKPRELAAQAGAGRFAAPRPERVHRDLRLGGHDARPVATK